MVTLGIFTDSPDALRALCGKLLLARQYRPAFTDVWQKGGHEIQIKGDPPCQVAWLAPGQHKINPDEIRSEYVTLSGDEPVPPLFSTRQQVVSFGFSHKNTISLSSEQHDHFSFSVQRKFQTATGQWVEPQEITLRPRPSAPPFELLGCCSALMLSGVGFDA